MEILHFLLQRLVNLNKMVKIISKTLTVILIIAGFQSCYYDNEEALYPSLGTCDTSNVTYSVTIAAIMAANCNSCHGSTLSNGNVITENYQGLKIIADNGKLHGVVNHLSGYQPMPKDRPQLSDCDLAKIDIWINSGALNN